MGNLKSFNFLKTNFYAILRYEEQDFQIYFLEEISKYIKFVSLKLLINGLLP